MRRAAELEQLEHFSHIGRMCARAHTSHKGELFQPFQIADRWALTVQGLQGIPWPAPAAMPGRVIECRDEPIEPDELAGVTNATELGLLLGISRQAAHKRIAKRAAAAAGPSCASPIRVIREPDSCAVPEFFTHLTPDA